jgi:methylenetetrahydrofolate dehydrogenase (NADP+)/methenyltetrahydrofolate cyclohydrolase
MKETILFDGREYAQKKLATLAERVEKLREKGIQIKMGSIFLTSDKGSVLYTNIKKRNAEMIGTSFQDCGMEKKDMNKIINQVREWNKDDSFQGILVQKPSGDNGFNNMEWDRIISEIDPWKDIDGLTCENLGHLSSTIEPMFIPATMRAVLEIIDVAKLDVSGKDVVIIGSSIIMGLPLSQKLIREEASVAVLNKKTVDRLSYTRRADLIVTATGSPEIIGAKDIKKGVVIIDVSSPRGDVRQEEIMGKASFYTPVPGGVGPVTVACLLENLVESVERNLVQ